jgi:hypothetical protein
MQQSTPLKPDDFPIETEQDKLRTQKGKKIAEAESEKTAQDIAQRLNELADREEQDRWSA